jgi:hypothetical protein
VRPVAGDLHEDDVASQGSDGRLVQTHAFGPARRGVLDDDVARTDKRLERHAIRGVPDVERDAALAAVHPHEAARKPARERVPLAGDVAAVRPLDLDDVGAEVGPEPRAERAGEAVLEGEHAGALEEHPRTVPPSL